jgi:hypothetical protein
VPGIIFQWQSSTTGDVDADYTPTGGTAATYDAVIGVPTWFRCRVECAATGEFALSTALLVSPDPPNAGDDATLTLCNTGQPQDMFDLLGNNADAGGIWSGPSPVVNGLFDPSTMVAGDYEYTVAGIAPCPDDAATVTVVLDPCLSIDELAGTGAVRWLGQEADGSHIVQVTGFVVKEWEVIDMAGRIVTSGRSAIQQERIRIPMDGARNGMHLIRLNSDAGMIPIRVIHSF